MNMIKTKFNYLFTIVVALSFFIISFYAFPKADDSREVALSLSLESWSRPSAPENLMKSASDFCEKWTGKKGGEVDCRTAYDVNTLTPVKSEQAVAAWQEALQSLAQQQLVLESLVKHLEGSRSQYPALTQPLLGLQLRLDLWAERIQQLKSATGIQGNEQSLYSDMFHLLLEQQGMSYNAAAGTFKKVNWHVVRATDQTSSLVSRANALMVNLALVPWVMAVCSAFLLILAGWRAQRMGWWLMLSFLGLFWLSLLVAADASVNYGQGSTFFSLNPLGNQFSRQVLVGGIAVVILTVGLLFTPIIQRLTQMALQNMTLTMVGLLLAMFVAYGLQGPAMGSEFLKLGTAVVAGLITATFGRSVHASAELSPGSLAPLRLIQVWTGRDRSMHDPRDAIAAVLCRPLIHFTLFCGLGVGAAALLFHDLGAALVTSIVAVSTLFMVFGARLALVVLSLGAMVAVLMSQTDKVQARIALMLDPLTASVSDFARLLAFSNASYERSFALGEIPWCSGSGTCIPLQALSDYMPVVLTGVFGPTGTLVFFLSFLLGLLGLAAWLMQKFLTLQGHTRALSMMAFFMLWATAAQTVVTFLGNWRLIPLTGLGTPLLSIGLSSTLVPVIAMTLIMVVKHQSPVGKS